MNNGFPTGGTLAADLIVRFDNTTASTLTMPARTDYQYVEIDNSGSTAGRVVTAGAGTTTVTDNLILLIPALEPVPQRSIWIPLIPFTVNGNTAAAATP